MKEVQYIKVNEHGNKFYYKDKEMTIYHRTNGPAIEFANGYKAWYINGNCHRDDGPAIERNDGSKGWYFNGKPHRTDGPAVEWANGDRCWWVNGKRHRTDGPALVFCNGSVKEWFLNDVELTEEEFKAKMQPKININGKDFTVEELNALIGAAKGK